MYIYDNSLKKIRKPFLSLFILNFTGHSTGLVHSLKLKRFLSNFKLIVFTAKKSYRYIIAALLTIMGIAAPLAMKAVGLIAYKALVISSVALTIAGIIALKKIYSNDHHHDETTFHVASGDHRRTAYLLRPHNGQATGQTPDAQNDPYRYYYDYPTQQAP